MKYWRYNKNDDYDWWVGYRDYVPIWMDLLEERNNISSDLLMEEYLIELEFGEE